MSQPAEYEPEHAVVVVFDVIAPTRRIAYERFAACFGLVDVEHSPHRKVLRELMSAAGIESWWFAEPDVKDIDGNDNPGFLLIPIEDNR